CRLSPFQLPESDGEDWDEPDSEAVDPAAATEQADLAERATTLLARLPDRERMVIESRCEISAGPSSFAAISHRVGRTRERVRQIFREGIEKLRSRIDRNADELFHW